MSGRITDHNDGEPQLVDQILQPRCLSPEVQACGTTRFSTAVTQHDHIRLGDRRSQLWSRTHPDVWFAPDRRKLAGTASGNVDDIGDNNIVIAKNLSRHLEPSKGALTRGQWRARKNCGQGNAQCIGPLRS